VLALVGIAGLLLAFLGWSQRGTGLPASGVMTRPSVSATSARGPALP